MAAIDERADTRRRILIVVPVFQLVFAEAFENFLLMVANAAHFEGDRYEFRFHVPARKILHSAMNAAAEDVLRFGYDAMIVFDDDCFPPIDAIAQLLRHFEAGHPVVAGLGVMRDFPHTYTLGRYYPEGPSVRVGDTGAVEWSGFEWVDHPEREPDDLIPVDFCGFPVCLIARSALAAMSRPWFGTHIDGGDCTHDVYFGAKAKRATPPQPILVDRRIACGHLAQGAIVSPANRDAIRRAFNYYSDAYLKAEGHTDVPLKGA